jgi:hypothetical protein
MQELKEAQMERQVFLADPAMWPQPELQQWGGASDWLASPCAWPLPVSHHTPDPDR